MHGLWGMGQMTFGKYIVVDELTAASERVQLTLSGVGLVIIR